MICTIQKFLYSINWFLIRIPKILLYTYYVKEKTLIINTIKKMCRCSEKLTNAYMHPQFTPGTYRKRIYVSLVHTDSFRQTRICAHSTLRVNGVRFQNHWIVDNIQSYLEVFKVLYFVFCILHYTC